MVRIAREDQKYSRDEIIALSEEIKAIVYARVSTNEQAEKGYSLQSQLEKGEELAKKKFSYRDDEILAVLEKGGMGDNPERPGINQVLSLIGQGVGKKLIMLHPDRLSRYLSLQNEIAAKIWNCGVDLEFVEFEIDPGNPESMLMFNIQGSIAQYNKAKILANSKRGRRQKVKQGKIPGIRRVYGYRFDKENDILVEDAGEKTGYLLMVEWLLNGKDGIEMNCSSIARELAKAGYPPPSSDRWYQATVSRILKNPIYTGNFYYGKSEVIQDKGKRKVIKKPPEEWQAVPVPQYIDHDTYREIRERLDSLVKKNRGPKTDNYLFRSLLRCGRCGAAVVSGPVTTLKSGKKIRYYICSNKAKKNYRVGTGDHNPLCPASGWRQDIVDEAVWKYILGLVDERKLIKEILAEEREEDKTEKLKLELKRLQARIVRKQNEQKRIIKAYREEIIDLALFKKEYHDLKQELDALIGTSIVLTRQIEEEKKDCKNDEAELYDIYLNKYRDIIGQDILTYEQKRKLIRTLVEKVILYEDTIEIILKWGDQTL